MSEQFQARETKKTYIAVVRGYTEDSGVIEHALVEKLDKIADKNASKDKEAQEATTEYERLATVELDFVKVWAIVWASNSNTRNPFI